MYNTCLSYGAFSDYYYCLISAAHTASSVLPHRTSKQHRGQRLPYSEFSCWDVHLKHKQSVITNTEMEYLAESDKEAEMPG